MKLHKAVAINSHCGVRPVKQVKLSGTAFHSHVRLGVRSKVGRASRARPESQPGELRRSVSLPARLGP